MSEKEQDKSAEEREKNPVAREDASHEKREKAIGRRRFMGLTFKAVVGGVGLTLFAQTRPAHARVCESQNNVCDTGGENECYGINNACFGTGGTNTCSAAYANVCNDGGEQMNICADTAPNECSDAGGANDCYGEVYNSCVTGSTNTCDGAYTNKCSNGSVNSCGTTNSCSSGAYANWCTGSDTGNTCSGTNDCSPLSAFGCTDYATNECTGTNTCSSNGA